MKVRSSSTRLSLSFALIVFMELDYITGLMCEVIDKKLSSAVGFKGICKKVLILMHVGVAHNVDLHVVGTGDELRSAVLKGMGVYGRGFRKQMHDISV